jgi:hypothetical protein
LSAWAAFASVRAGQVGSLEVALAAAGGDVNIRDDSCGGLSLMGTDGREARAVIAGSGLPLTWRALAVSILSPFQARRSLRGRVR